MTRIMTARFQNGFTERQILCIDALSDVVMAEEEQREHTGTRAYTQSRRV